MMNAIAEVINPRPVWTVTKFEDNGAIGRGEHYEKSVIEGNLLLNEGITEFLSLLTGASATAFSNANARLGVGDSTTAAAATQTALQGTTNKLYKAMESGYPTVTNQSVNFRSVFGSSEANFGGKSSRS
jgi:hypothetical protein